MIPFVVVVVAVVAFFDLRDASRDGRAGGAGGLADRQLIAANDATIFNFDRASPSWTRRSVGGARRFSGDAPRDAEPPGDTSPPAPRAANVASTAARAAASISSRVSPNPEFDARAPPGVPASASECTRATSEARHTFSTSDGAVDEGDAGLFADVDIAVRRRSSRRARSRSRSTSARTVAAPADSRPMDGGGSSRGGDSPKSTNAVDLDGASTPPASSSDPDSKSRSESSSESSSE